MTCRDLAFKEWSTHDAKVFCVDVFALFMFSDSLSYVVSYRSSEEDGNTDALAVISYPSVIRTEQQIFLS